MAYMNSLEGNNDVLTALLSGASPGFAGGALPNQEQMIPGMGGLEQTLAQNQQLGQRQQMQQQPKQRGWLGNILGILGDALLVGNGAPPMYRQGKEKARRAAAYRNFLDDPEGTIRALFEAGDPEAALELLKSQQGEGFTLGEGQARYDSRGRQIAAGPNKLDIIEIDGVAFDKRTGEPLFESPYSRIIPGAEGSFFEQPRKGLGRGRPSPQGGGDLQAQAEEAIRMGADPAEVNRRLQEMTGGATAGPSPIFP